MTVSRTRYLQALPPRRPPRKLPVLRIFLLLLALWFLYHEFNHGKLAAFWEKSAAPADTLAAEILPAPPRDSVAWRAWCADHSGQSFVLSPRLVQCSWSFASRQALGEALSQEPAPIANRVLYAASRQLFSYPMQLHWVSYTQAPQAPRVLDLRSDRGELRLLAMPGDSLTGTLWLDAYTGCAYPGPCPHDPLEGGAVPIPDDFDFAGREYLLTRDLFRGIGESPVFPVLSGRVTSISKDSSGFSVELYHGDNLYSRSSGLSGLYAYTQPGARLAPDMPVGRLSAQDTASFYLEILRNGKFLRWQDFWQETHPVALEQIATFRNSFGY